METGVQLGDQFVSQQEFNVMAARAATGFAGLGVKRGNTIALMLRNDIPFLVTSMASRLIGAFPVPMNWHLSGPEANYILTDCKAKVLVIHDEILDRIGTQTVPDGVQIVVVRTPEVVAQSCNLAEISDDIPEGAIRWEEWLPAQEPWTEQPAMETASVIYTSGTTGRPKGVLREESTHEEFMRGIQIVGGVLGIEPGLRTVIPAPLYHSAPNSYAIFSLMLGGFVVLMPRFDPEELLRLIDKHKVTRLQTVPTMFVRLLKLPEEVRKKYDTSSLEYVVHAAAPCPPDVKKAMIDWWGPVIYEYYGSTEMGTITLANSEDALKYPGTVGKGIPEATIRIYDEDGKELGPNEIGTVYARLEANRDFTYIGAEDKRRSIEREGLITCGDVGYLNEEGYLFLCDRAADMIISGGVNIYPAEIESVLITHEGVKDCAVFGIPHEEFGEQVMAVIEPRDAAALDADEIKAWLGERIAHYKVPRVVEFRNNLPREDSGKLFKRKLREPYWEKAGRKI